MMTESQLRKIVREEIKNALKELTLANIQGIVRHAVRKEVLQLKGQLVSKPEEEQKSEEQKGGLTDSSESATLAQPSDKGIAP